MTSDTETRPVLKRLAELSCGPEGFGKAYAAMQGANPNSPLVTLGATEQQIVDYGKLLYSMAVDDDRGFVAEYDGRCVGMFVACEMDVLMRVDPEVLGDNPCKYHIGMCKELQDIITTKFYKGQGVHKVLYGIFGGVTAEWCGKELFSEMQIACYTACQRSGVNYIWGFTQSPAVITKFISKQKGMTVNNAVIVGDKQTFVKQLLGLPIDKLKVMLEIGAKLRGDKAIRPHMREIYDMTSYRYNGYQPFKERTSVIWMSITPTSLDTIYLNNDSKL
eukprot:TRINITY_DN7548_c0_g1_i1.p1 TRINITY_DN7548_c0_g1~~TRINITY_DN7548_c0_g1_i1.p1  ORF type:complete len:276 (+),score=80.52 TRINITY_DN7548_c0_g1_i1:933-1760(+)